MEKQVVELAFALWDKEIMTTEELEAFLACMMPSTLLLEAREHIAVMDTEYFPSSLLID